MMAADGGGGGAGQPVIDQIANFTADAAKQAVVMQGSATNLVSAAGGGFKLDPAAAASLAASCRESLDYLEAIKNDIQIVGQAPNLGTLPGVSDIASFTQSVGSDEQGIERAVASLVATLQQMEQAYLKASTNYQETNDQVADAMKSFALQNPNLASAPTSAQPATSSGPDFNPTPASSATPPAQKSTSSGPNFSL
jgi:hypothetical protein